MPGQPEANRKLLEQGLAQLALEAPEAAIDALLAYTTELQEWSATYNLVARGDKMRLLPRHVLDSLSVTKFLQPGSLLDIGTGAGLPGVPLAIIAPHRQVTVIDSAGKKIRFVRHVGRLLQLNNLQSLEQRVESLDKNRVFANIISRAFASLQDFVTAASVVAQPDSLLLAMKGNYPQRELEELPDWVNVRSVETLDVPYLHAHHHLVIMALTRRSGKSVNGHTWHESSQ